MQRLKIILRKEIKITNVVCTTDLKQPVNIASFNECKFLSSNLNLYRCGYVKDNTMKGRVSVFASGKLISVGTTSPKQAYSELEKATKILRKYHLIKPCKIVPKIQNIVSIAFLGKKLNLNKLARTLPRVIYEPEQFAGLTYRIRDSLVALIFASGKVVMVGAKTINELNQALFELQERIERITP